MSETTPTLPVVPPPAAIRPSLRHLFDRGRVDDERAGVLLPIELPEGDPLRIDLHERREYSPDDPRETGPAERRIVHVYDLATGERLMTRALASEWWLENMGHITPEALAAWMDDRPNQWLATDRHLLISGGRWWRGPDSPTGDLVYTSVSRIRDEMLERNRSAQAHWGKLHREAIDAFRPAWADRVSFHGDDELLEAEGMTFERREGRVVVRFEVLRREPGTEPQHGDVDGFYPATGVPYVDLSDVDDELPALDAAAVALSLAVAVSAITGAPVNIEAGTDAAEPTTA